MTQDNPPLFAWQASANAAMYQLQIDTALSFTRPVYSDSSLSPQLRPRNLVLGPKPYHWRIRARNGGGGWCAWSDPLGFKVRYAATDSINTTVACSDMCYTAQGLVCLTLSGYIYIYDHNDARGFTREGVTYPNGFMISAQGPYVYVFESVSYLFLSMFDISDPTHPVFLRSYRNFDIQSYDKGYCHYPYYYIRDRDSLFILDVSGPDSIRLAGRMGFAGAEFSLRGQGDHLIGINDAAIHVFDITDPLRPSLACTLPTSIAGSLESAVMGQRRLFVMAGAKCYPFDITDFAAITPLPVIDAGRQIYRSVPAGDSLIVSSGAGITIWGEQSGSYRKQATIGRDLSCGAVAGKYLFMGSGHWLIAIKDQQP
jgi:hypothetical protein